MGKDRGRNDERSRIAHLAARLMAEDGIEDYAIAKRKAARQAGIPDQVEEHHRRRPIRAGHGDSSVLQHALHVFDDVRDRGVLLMTSVYPQDHSFDHRSELGRELRRGLEHFVLGHPGSEHR